LQQGLDQGDAFVRARIIEKMKILSAELASSAPFSLAQLKHYYEDNIDQYAWPRRVDIWQAFYGNAERGERSRGDCEAVWDTIQVEGDLSFEQIAASADTHVRYRRDMRQMSLGDLQQLFGAETGQAVFRTDKGRWFSPIMSDAGCHLVHILDVHPGGRASFPEVRGRIEAQLETERNRDRVRAAYETLSARYQIIYE